MLFRRSKKIYTHIDCDCFFASCEILRNPKLKGKRVCVWWDIIIACSYEAKALGIKTWTPIWEAKKILGNTGIYFSPDHNYYTEISDKLMKYLEYHTLCMEPYSIDEAFCEVTGLPEMNNMSLWTYIRKLQKEVTQAIWIPVSIGVSNTRIKAKIYSKINKPYGIYIWYNQEQEFKLFKKLPIKDIPYIWKAHQERYKYGCTSIHDFIGRWFKKLKSEIWKNWTDLWLELCWVNAFVVKKTKEVKSIWRSRSFNKQMTWNYIFLKEQLLINFNRVFEEIVNKNFEIKSISIMMRKKDFSTYMYEYKLNDFSNSRNDILEIIISLFDKNYESNSIYRSTWVVLSKFRSYLPRQTSIFDTPLRSKEHNYELTKIVNNLNQRYWDHVVSFWFSLLWKWKEAKLGILK